MTFSLNDNDSLKTTDCKVRTLGALNIRQPKLNNQIKKERKSLYGPFCLQSFN